MLSNQTQKRVIVGTVPIYYTLKATKQKHRSEYSPNSAFSMQFLLAFFWIRPGRKDFPSSACTWFLMLLYWCLTLSLYHLPDIICVSTTKLTAILLASPLIKPKISVPWYLQDRWLTQLGSCKIGDWPSLRQDWPHIDHTLVSQTLTLWLRDAWTLDTCGSSALA